jgi:hypothetical protein
MDVRKLLLWVVIEGAVSPPFLPISDPFNGDLKRPTQHPPLSPP